MAKKRAKSSSLACSAEAAVRVRGDRKFLGRTHDDVSVFFLQNTKLDISEFFGLFYDLFGVHTTTICAAYTKWKMHAFESRKTYKKYS